MLTIKTPCLSLDAMNPNLQGSSCGAGTTGRLQTLMENRGADRMVESHQQLQAILVVSRIVFSGNPVVCVVFACSLPSGQCWRLGCADRRQLQGGIQSTSCRSELFPLASSTRHVHKSRVSGYTYIGSHIKHSMEAVLNETNASIRRDRAGPEQIQLLDDVGVW